MSLGWLEKIELIVEFCLSLSLSLLVLVALLKFKSCQAVKMDMNFGDEENIQ